MAAGYMPGCEIEIPATPDYYTADQMIAYAAASAAAEREACAQICDAHTVDDTLVGVGISRSCADMIRRRSIIADYPGRDK